MSLSRVDSDNSSRLHSSNPPPAELNLATSTAVSDKPVVVVKTTAEADTELATMLADHHQGDWSFQRVSPETSFGKWKGHFNKAWNWPAMQAWVSAQNFGMHTFNIVGSTLTVKAQDTGKITTFTPSDGSGWWPIGRQVIASAAMLDPQGKDLGSPGARSLPAEIAAFYGVRWPINKSDAEALKANGFPVISVEDDPLRSPEMRKLAEHEFMDVENESALIKTLLSKLKDKPDEEDIDLRTISQDIAPGSSLGIANRSGLKILRRLMREPLMAPILSAKNIGVNAQVRLENGQFMVSANGTTGPWHNVTEQVLAHPTLAQLLDCAIQQSEATGKIIRSQSAGDLWQLLRFATSSELPAINTAGELRKILNWKLNPLPPEPELGSYGRNFLEDKQSPDCLTEEQRIRVRRSAPGTSTPPPLTLLDCSPKPWAGRSPEYIRQNADELISRALTQGAGLKRCEPILAALKDDPSEAPGESSPSYRKQLILTRDLLVIDPTLGTQRNYIGGYNLYSASNTGKTLFEVRTELEHHLVRVKKLPQDQAILVTHALLTTVAPEFLVKDAQTVRVGTLPMVSLRVQTALAEMASQGSSRLMSAGQLGSRALLKPISPEHEQLEIMHSAGPIYDWALAQGVVTEEDDYSPMALNAALTAYNQRVADSGTMATRLDRTRSLLKSRTEVGEQELERVCPDQTEFLNKQTILFNPSSLLASAAPLNHLANLIINSGDGPTTTVVGLLAGPCSIKDLYLSGELTADNINTKQWDFINPQDQAAFEALKPKLRKLKPIEAVFTSPFMSGLDSLTTYQRIATKMLLSDMPVEDRRRLEFGEVTVYGASTQEGGLSQQEAQQKIGPILFLKDASGAKCYELFPATNSYVERPELVGAMGNMSASGTDSFGYIMRRRLSPTLPVDIDVKAHFPATPGRQKASAGIPNTYSSTRTNEILSVLQLGSLLVDRSFLMTQAAGTTYNEAVQQRLDAIDTFVINTLIPFKGNIEEIASGDRRRVALGAIGLGLEIVGALFVVAGAVSAVAKAASIATKLTLAGKTVLSMFNLPGAVAGTAKSLFRLTSVGVRGLGVNVPRAMGKGLSDLRKLVSGGGKKTQNLVRLSPRERVGKEVNNLMGNIALPNTVNGTIDFASQSPTQVSKGSNSPAI
ncbi:hypothetical protein [Pseudomonas sp. L1(2025)]|uniref:hypothetical protein n=1 Tax=Pseudomonas sp. L1(2025) TaxID=3449429 RepID=UPI003F68C691